MERDTKRLIDWKEEKGNKVVSRALKNLILVSAFLLWILSGLFAAVAGLMIARDYEFEVISGFMVTPPAFFAAISCYIFVVSSFGVMGALRENICCLRVYQYSIVLTLLLIFCAGLLGFAFWPEIKKLMETKLRSAIIQYVDSEPLRNLIDMIQRELECCGGLNIDDWDSNPYFTCFKKGSYRSCGVPWSCCFRKHERNRMCGLRIRRKRTNLGNTIHLTGCLDKTFEYIRVNMYIIGAVCVGATLFFVVVMYALHVLVRQIQKQIVLYDKATELYNWDLQDEGTIGTIGTIDSREDLLVPVAYEESQRNNIEM